MAYKQKYTPNVGQSATRGWCLMYIDDAGKVAKSLPPRTKNARAALNAEIKAGRIRTSTPPEGIWVVGFLDLRSGPNAADDHVFFMKNKGNGKFEIRDSETNGGGRGVYGSIKELTTWFGNYNPSYVGWSTHCDGRQYAEEYTPVAATKPATNGTRKSAKGTFKVTVDKLNVRNSPDAKNGKVVATYKKGEKINYDSFIVTNGYVWLSYVSNSGVRRYIAEGPNDGKENTVYGTGGV